MILENKVVLISGANGGIGEKIVQEFLDEKVAKIYACARNVDSLKEVCKLDPNKVIAKRLDITDISSITKLVKECDDVNVLVNNAGVNYGKGIFSGNSIDFARSEMEVNYFGTFNMSTLFSETLKRNGGAIVNVCSLLSFVCMPANATYCASKAALFSFTQALKGELAPYNINVLGVFPGPVDTSMTAGLDVEKITPTEVAREIVVGLKNDSYKVLPGEESKETYKNLIDNYEDVEDAFSKII